MLVPARINYGESYWGKEGIILIVDLKWRMIALMPSLTEKNYNDVVR